MTKEEVLTGLRALHKATRDALDAVPLEYRKPYLGAATDEPERMADSLYGRQIALGTAIQYVEQIE